MIYALVEADGRLAGWHTEEYPEVPEGMEQVVLDTTIGELEAPLYEAPGSTLWWEDGRVRAEAPPPEAGPAELSDAIAEVAALAASNEAAIDGVVDALVELAALVAGGGGE